MQLHKGISTTAGVITIVIVALILFGGVFVYQYIETQNKAAVVSPTQPTQPASTNPTVSTAGWQTITNSQYQFSFQYPPTLNTMFATFQNVPNVIVTAQGSTAVNTNGCYLLSNDDQYKESHVTINGMQFCLTTGSGVGAGQLYSDYYYTTYQNGNYFTVAFTVHTPNGCGAYEGTSNSQACTDFFNNYDSIVTQPIEKSVSTLTFWTTQAQQPQTSCSSAADCPASDSCMAEGPIVANQPVHKVCVAPGQAVPL